MFDMKWFSSVSSVDFVCLFSFSLFTCVSARSWFALYAAATKHHLQSPSQKSKSHHSRATFKKSRESTSFTARWFLVFNLEFLIFDIKIIHFLVPNKHLSFIWLVLEYLSFVVFPFVLSHLICLFVGRCFVGSKIFSYRFWLCLALLPGFWSTLRNDWPLIH